MPRNKRKLQMKQRTLLLDNVQIKQRLKRIACQVYEDSYDEKEIIVAGIANSGYILAKKLVDILKKNYPLDVTLLEVTIDKDNPLQPVVKGAVGDKAFHKKTIILVDDVLNSGKTLMHSMRPFLEGDAKKIRTVLLVDRDHKKYPVAADYVGITLSTTFKEHVCAELSKGKEDAVYLE